jgi:hypothetical protein
MRLDWSVEFNPFRQVSGAEDVTFFWKASAGGPVEWNPFWPSPVLRGLNLKTPVLYDHLGNTPWKSPSEADLTHDFKAQPEEIPVMNVLASGEGSDTTQILGA